MPSWVVSAWLVVLPDGVQHLHLDHPDTTEDTVYQELTRLYTKFRMRRLAGGAFVVTEALPDEKRLDGWWLDQYGIRSR